MHAMQGVHLARQRLGPPEHAEMAKVEKKAGAFVAKVGKLDWPAQFLINPIQA